MALAVDVPYLPQLPTREPRRADGPRGAGGASRDWRRGEDGACTVELGAWEAGQAELRRRGSTRRSAAEMPPHSFQGWPAARALRPFLWEVRERKLAFAKAQLAGPATVRWSSRLSTGEPLSDHPGLDAQVFRLLLVRSLALVQAVRAAGATAALLPRRAGALRPGHRATPRTSRCSPSSGSSWPRSASRARWWVCTAAGTPGGARCSTSASICCRSTCGSRWTRCSRSRGWSGASSTGRGVLPGARPDRPGPGGGPGGARPGGGDLVRGGAPGPAGGAPSLRRHPGLRAGDAERARGGADLRAAQGRPVRPAALSSALGAGAAGGQLALGLRPVLRVPAPDVAALDPDLVRPPGDLLVGREGSRGDADAVKLRLAWGRNRGGATGGRGAGEGRAGRRVSPAGSVSLRASVGSRVSVAVLEVLFDDVGTLVSLFPCGPFLFAGAERSVQRPTVQRR